MSTTNRTHQTVRTRHDRCRSTRRRRGRAPHQATRRDTPVDIKDHDDSGEPGSENLEARWIPHPADRLSAIAAWRAVLARRDRQASATLAGLALRDGAMRKLSRDESPHRFADGRDGAAWAVLVGRRCGLPGPDVPRNTRICRGHSDLDAFELAAQLLETGDHRLAHLPAH